MLEIYPLKLSMADLRIWLKQVRENESVIIIRSKSFPTCWSGIVG